MWNVGLRRARLDRDAPPCASATAATIDEAEPDAAARARARLVGAVEALEDVRRAAPRVIPGPESATVEHRASPSSRASAHARPASRPACARARSRAGCRRSGAAGRGRRATVARLESSSIGRSGSTVRAVSTASRDDARRARPARARAGGPRRGARAAAGRRRAALIRSDSRADARHRALEVVRPVAAPRVKSSA